MPFNLSACISALTQALKRLADYEFITNHNKTQTLHGRCLEDPPRKETSPRAARYHDMGARRAAHQPTSPRGRGCGRAKDELGPGPGCGAACEPLRGFSAEMSLRQSTPKRRWTDSDTVPSTRKAGRAGRRGARPARNGTLSQIESRLAGPAGRDDTGRAHDPGAFFRARRARRCRAR